ncbi:MAG: ribulose-phosphate 3-epimerase, partial [Planctomycetota bacterium]
GADWIHVDCMDGHFVPNLSIGAPVVKSLRAATDLPLDVHLMISDPAKYLDEFIEAGSDSITFHIEAVSDPAPLLQRIRAAGRKAGLAIRPKTPASAVTPFAALCDLYVIMTVEPGFGGQSFMPEPLGKIPELLAAGRAAGLEPEIEVDGGIDLTTLPEARAAGATVFVAGSAIFQSEDVPSTVRSFCELLQQEVS